MTDHTRTFHAKFFTGPLSGRTVAVDANSEYHAATRIADALGMGAMNCADWPVPVEPPGLFDDEPVQTITIQQALEALR